MSPGSRRSGVRGRAWLHPWCLGPIGHGLHCCPLSTAPASPSRGARSWAWRPGCRTQVWETGSAPGAACGEGGPPTPQDPWRQHNQSAVLVVCGRVFSKLIAFSLRHLCFKIALDVPASQESPRRSSDRRTETSGVVAASVGTAGGRPWARSRWTVGSARPGGGARSSWAPHGGFPLKGRDRGGRQPTRVKGTSRSLGSQALSVARRPPSRQHAEGRTQAEPLPAGPPGRGSVPFPRLAGHGRCLRELLRPDPLSPLHQTTA